MASCIYCGGKVTPGVEKTSVGLFGKPVCTKVECEKKANAEAAKATDAPLTPYGKVLALLARRGFVEQSVKGFFLLEEGETKTAVDLSKDPTEPKVGVLQVNGDILEDGHGIGRIDDLRRYIEGILKSKGAGGEKKDIPAPEPPKSEEPKEFVIPENVLAALKDHAWTIDLKTAAKIIDGKLVTIDLSRIEQRGKAACVEGAAYEFGKNNIIDAELKSLFGSFVKSNNGHTVPAPHNEIGGGNLPAVSENTPLSVSLILKYINPEVSEEEAYMFLRLCEGRGLNPFLKEAYLVKYGNSPATMIVGKDAFTRKAEESGKLDGYETGIIVLPAGGGNWIEREGTILNDGEILIGGWAKVYRKSMSKPFHIQVSMKEYDKKKNNWLTMPATMIRKVALVQALREAFTKELGGCYGPEEMGVD